eukprot:2679039-Pyramimonas_sp.AAC.1
MQTDQFVGPTAQPRRGRSAENRLRQRAEAGGEGAGNDGSGGGRQQRGTQPGPRCVNLANLRTPGEEETVDCSGTVRKPNCQDTQSS